MRFVAISDTHGKHKGLKLPKGDVLLHAGDITFKGQEAEVKDFLKWFSAQPFAYKIFIAGNHDFFLEKAKPEELAKLIPKDVIYLQDSGLQIDQVKIWGTPVTPWFYNWAFNRLRGNAIREHWNQIPKDTNLLITHGPAFGLLDEVCPGKHTGCRDLLQCVLDIKPRVHVFGHIHEAYGQQTRKGIQFINASLLNEHYERVNAPVVFKW